MRKIIDLPKDVIRAISIQAIENDSNFKNYVEAKLTELAKAKAPRVKEKKENPR